MAKIPVAVQIYSVRELYKSDLRATLREVAGMGYEGVDFYGDAPLPARELRAVLDDLGLKCAGWHVSYLKFDPSVIQETIDYHSELGNKYLIVPGLPRDQFKSHDDMKRWAHWFDANAATLAPHGMVTGYHSHDGDHKVIDGHTLWDTLFGATGQNVVMQIDLGNSAHGGVDVVSELRKYPGRATTVHLKPYSPSLKAGGQDPFGPVIGKDELDWNTILNVCETTAGTAWYIVEYECDALPAMDGIRLCLEGLRHLGR
ncbi:MAG: hypothetical protein RL022_1837 [Chloroflexota bacterium]